MRFLNGARIFIVPDKKKMISYLFCEVQKFLTVFKGLHIYFSTVNRPGTFTIGFDSIFQVEQSKYFI